LSKRAPSRGTYAWAHTLHDSYHWLPDLDQLSKRLASFASERLGEGLAWATGLLGAIFELFIILIVTFFLLLDGPDLKYGWLLLISPPQRARFEALIDPIALKLGGYVQGIMISIGALAGFLAVGLSVVHEPLALALALLSGLLAIIPLVGGYLGLLPAFLLALTVSWHLAIVVWVIYYIGNTIVGHFVIPFVFARSVAVSPLLIMLALLVGAELDGVAGALIAVPVLAALIVLVKNFHVIPQEAEFKRPAVLDVKHSEPLRVTFRLPE
jgi:predicted PurR-regulated permease PerM